MIRTLKNLSGKITIQYREKDIVHEKICAYPLEPCMQSNIYVRELIS